MEGTYREAGKVIKNVEVDTIFTKRKIESINIKEESVEVNYQKISEDGQMYCKKMLDPDIFKTLEDDLWHLLDGE